ncbi:MULTISPECIES: ABC-three component system middle component 2 [unclassified Hymenobacter]|uniref:ABC-three component system middle component 2 n=1 Tax=unclassified Hymenobacter TaxID=2615202 RepID=UPI001653B055|nr:MULTISPECIES: ABC-three component system middle component 2 [unclassified Hymenobacter]MBC6992168.1 hypothetical protein [Hymenobacter sp. BT491]MCC3154737.1 hypothetical protein [Hymenobacter sp. BT770]MDO3416548.1 hypothetical protein [Hymenobacter sp. BT770]
MEQIKSLAPPNNIPRPFNQPLELGLRALYILGALRPLKTDLQRLLFLDYILVHSADIEGGPESLHAAVPYRTGEWLAHKTNLEKGLLMFAAKELVTKEFSSEGIVYFASDLTIPFTDHLSSSYSKALKSRARWLVERFGQTSLESMSKLMLSNISVWGSEMQQMSNARNKITP